VSPDEKAIAECGRAVSLNPGSFEAITEYGGILMYAGRYQEAITVFQKAVRINPMGKSGLFRAWGIALLFDGQIEESIPAFKTSLQRSPRDVMTHIVWCCPQHGRT
jgi:tetratricopeptide (TPR) repeat protein